MSHTALRIPRYARAVLRVMSFNILEGGEGYAEQRSASVLELIETAKPDVLVVCEANGFERKGSSRLYDFERRLGMRGALALATTGFHVAVLAREAEWLSAETLTGFHHAALRVKLRLLGQSLTVVGAHLCPFGALNRLCEAEILANEAKPEEAVLLLGDLNALSPVDDAEVALSRMSPHRRARHESPSIQSAMQGDRSAVKLLLAAGFADLGATLGNVEPTYPTLLRSEASKPSIRIDYILATPKLAVRARSFTVLRGELAERASDHYAILTEIET